MEILRTIADYSENYHLPFLLIGGHAVNVYGISRQTGDIDLVVKREQKESWSDLMIKLSYVPGQDDERFARYRPDKLAAWPIDLMFVDENTFEKLQADSRRVSIGAAQVSVASARHLVTLKLHAMKHYQEHRFAKDYTDLLQLLKLKETSLSQEDFHELCLKYASQEIYDRVVADYFDKGSGNAQ